MYIYAIVFKAVQNPNRPARQVEYDEAGYVLDNNNIRCAAASWEDAVAYARTIANGREIKSITRQTAIDLAPIVRLPQAEQAA